MMYPSPKQNAFFFLKLLHPLYLVSSFLQNVLKEIWPIAISGRFIIYLLIDLFEPRLMIVDPLIPFKGLDVLCIDFPSEAHLARGNIGPDDQEVYVKHLGEQRERQRRVWFGTSKQWEINRCQHVSCCPPSGCQKKRPHKNKKRIWTMRFCAKRPCDRCSI